MAHRAVQEPDDGWLASADSFFSDGREVLLSIKYLHNSPPMNFALLKSTDQLRLIVDLCPIGAEMRLWRDAEFPFRGQLTSALIAEIRASLADNSDTLCLFLQPASDADPRLEGDSWNQAEHMFPELAERMGEPVAVGRWPAIAGSIRAVKGGMEGPR